jgi:hypothetical protein
MKRKTNWTLREVKRFIDKNHIEFIPSISLSGYKWERELIFGWIYFYICFSFEDKNYMPF